MFLFDTSSIIYAWDNYPIDNFPPLWDWLSKQIKEKKFLLSKIVYEETKKNSPDCAEWLNRSSVEHLIISNDILQFATEVKNLLQIEDDNYHPNGIGENDIIIIATAKKHALILVSEEGRQANPPPTRRKYKIPTVCNLTEVKVECIQFIDIIKKSGEKFV